MPRCSHNYWRISKIRKWAFPIKQLQALFHACAVNHWPKKAVRNDMEYGIHSCQNLVIGLADKWISVINAPLSNISFLQTGSRVPIQLTVYIYLLSWFFTKKLPSVRNKLPAVRNASDFECSSHRSHRSVELLAIAYTHLTCYWCYDITCIVFMVNMGFSWDL